MCCLALAISIHSHACSHTLRLLLAGCASLSSALTFCACLSVCLHVFFVCRPISRCFHTLRYALFVCFLSVSSCPINILGNFSPCLCDENNLKCSFICVFHFTDFSFSFCCENWQFLNAIFMFTECVCVKHVPNQKVLRWMNHHQKNEREKNPSPRSVCALDECGCLNAVQNIAPLDFGAGWWLILQNELGHLASHKLSHSFKLIKSDRMHEW